MNTVLDIFERIGSPGAFAAMVGVKYSAATEMKRRRSIPVQYWPALVEGCRQGGIEGVDFDLLVALHAKRANPEPDAAA